MSTIPASQLVNVIPTVLSAGGDALDLNGLVLTNSNRVPQGTVGEFPDSNSVSSYFGASSLEASLAAVYFPGFIGATAFPGKMLFANYPATALSAYLRGANVSSFTLTQLQALAGQLAIVVDGYSRNVASISLSGAVSFSNAAAIIGSALNGSAPANLASFNGTISGGTLTVISIASGTILSGQTVNGTGVIAGIYINAQLTGSAGGTGTYQLNGTTTGVGPMTTSATPITVTYDSVSGGFLFTSGVSGNLSTIAFATGSLATALSLTLATGAVISQGAPTATPAAFMDVLATATRNWALFTTSFDPDNGSGNTQKLAFGQWTSSQNNRFGYVPWDTDASPTVSANAPSSLGQLLTADGYNGVCPVWDNTGNGPELAAFVLGCAASINFDQTNGRISFAFKASTGIVPAVTDALTASNLQSNHYNFYGAYATANQTFQFFQNGALTGPFLWLDSYINQIWLNAQLQLAFINYLAGVNSVPYNQSGYAGLENALLSNINQALNAGVIRVGVVLSSSQIQQINSQAGANVASTVTTQGWYLQVRDPGPSARAARTSPVCNLWYADGGSVQRINLASIEVQ